MNRFVKILFLSSLIFLNCVIVFPQGDNTTKEGIKWYFGKNAALDFSQWLPRFVEGSEMVAREGCASISNKDGDLLFYTNGETVWKSNNEVMLEGADLNGNTSATQSAVIIPKPGSSDIFYIFTVDDFAGGKGLSYSVVDMSIPGGGGVVWDEKNRKPPGAENKLFTEKIASAKHSNGRDYWVVTHEWGNSNFYSYLINSNGIQNPIIQTMGENHGHPSIHDEELRLSTGYLKISPHGNKIAAAIEGEGIIDIFNFNTGTGYLSINRKITGIKNVYGLEFSISEQFLYASQRLTGEPHYIYQWDLSSNDQETIVNSRTIIGDVHPILLNGALQLAPNGKIYIAFSGKNYIGVINSPNKKGELCNYDPKGVSLGDGLSYMGLPTFISTFFEGDGFVYSDICFGDTTKFTFTSLYAPESIEWNFDDGTLPLKNIYDPTHIFLFAREFTVRMTTVRDGIPEYVEKKIVIHPAPEINLGGDEQDICFGDQLILDAGSANFYEWNTGWVHQQIAINEAGTYSVTVTDFNLCKSISSVEVTVLDLPHIEQVPTTDAYCGSPDGTASVIPEGEINEYTYQWINEDGDSIGTRSTIEDLAYGVYTVSVTSILTGCTKTINDVGISEKDAPPVYISASIEVSDTICPGTAVILTANEAVSYEWNNNSTSSELLVYPEENTIYSVTGSATFSGTGRECSAVAFYTVNVRPQQGLDLGEDQVRCMGEEIILDAGDRESWLWQDESKLQKFTVNNTGTYYVAVTDSFNCVAIDSVGFHFNPVPPVNIGPQNSTSCMGKEIILDATTFDGVEYLWSDSTSSAQLTVTETGNYKVIVTNEFGCVAEDDINLLFYSPDSLKINKVEKTDISCFGANDGKIDIYAYGLVGFFSYSIDGGESWSENDGKFKNLPAMQGYQIRVKEKFACEKEGPSITLTQPEEIQIVTNIRHPSCFDCDDGRISLSIKGGIPPYQFLWTNLDTSNFLTNIPSGTYTAVITDSMGCTTIFRNDLDYADNFFLEIPNAFTPNGDGINDMWTFGKLKENRFRYPALQVKVFDQTGRLVFDSPIGYPQEWDGKFEGKTLPTNTYYYIIQPGPNSKPYHGTITIIH